MSEHTTIPVPATALDALLLAYLEAQTANRVNLTGRGTDAWLHDFWRVEAAQRRYKSAADAFCAAVLPTWQPQREGCE